jgi:hypothetical protein
MAHQLRPARVAWEASDLVLPAMVEVDRYWNGFLYPYFDKAAIDTYIAWQAGTDGEYARLAWQGTVLHVVETDGVDDYPYDLEPVDGLYPLGAGAWTWQEVLP